MSLQKTTTNKGGKFGLVKQVGFEKGKISVAIESVDNLTVPPRQYKRHLYKSRYISPTGEVSVLFKADDSSTIDAGMPLKLSV